ncbi:hypothetical protein MtrunA17_Chr2g0300661 [Medicago truncatula]|uniref:Transmembrane protein n=1 Tax=Medicago truncatula TaxID=3880 RepID=A0A396J640_MEDTR|nr:hypothetical protein MtrunA17_Chr2g0300661 [Medicago truncatula]
MKCPRYIGYTTLAVGAQWIFRPVQGLISPVLCSCDVLLLLLTGTNDRRLSDQQMALLQYQRENLHFMNEEILRLQESLSKYE